MFKYGPKEVLPILWIPRSVPSVWFMGEQCIDEERQNVYGFMSDDTTGLEYAVFFDMETRRIVKAVNGLNIEENDPLDENFGFEFENTRMTANIIDHEVVHSFNGDLDFTIFECMKGEDWMDRFENKDEMLKLTADMGFNFF